MASAQQVRNDAPVSANAPVDKPVSLRTEDATSDFDRKIAPYVAKAKKTLPAAKKRFLAGLKPGEAFFLTTRIYDTKGRMEQVFVRVTSWEGSEIRGTLASEIGVVSGYRAGQSVAFSEDRVLDWLITQPDGTEEGNFIGKYMDTQAR